MILRLAPTSRPGHLPRFKVEEVGRMEANLSASVGTAELGFGCFMMF